MPFQFAAPVIVDDIGKPELARRMVQLRQSSQKDGGPRYLEAFLQRLIHAEPSVLPVEELEPSFRDLRAVCEELPIARDGSKYLDNLLVNPDGRICLVECKLWRNPEAIRSVVAQILDYAGEMSSMSYEDLRAAVRRALRQAEGDPLIERVLGVQAFDEDKAAFIDAVTRSLQLGNFLLVIVGDGIRSGLQQIAGLLQNRATLGFSFALIEMSIYRQHDGNGPYYVQARRLLQTEIITRHVFVSGHVQETGTIAAVTGGGKAQTISDQEFFSDLEKINPSYPEALRSFLDKARAVGCQPELRRGYSLYIDEPNGSRINLGTIDKQGNVSVWGVGSRDHTYGEPVGRRYMERLVGFLPGTDIKNEAPNPSSCHLRHKGRSTIPLSTMLTHEDAWLAAIREVVDWFQVMEPRSS